MCFSVRLNRACFSPNEGQLGCGQSVFLFRVGLLALRTVHTTICQSISAMSNSAVHSCCLLDKLLVSYLRSISTRTFGLFCLNITFCDFVKDNS